jgi:hypothetical protein
MTEDLAFFLDRLNAEIPQRIHSRETDDGGNPQWHRAFELWLTDGDGRWQTMVRDETEFCNHPTQPNGGHCETCDDSGLRSRVRLTFRNPMKRALHRLGCQPVPKGRPKLNTVLWALAENDGNIDLAIAALRSEYEYFWVERRARGWITHALFELRHEYREDAPARVLDKSESQNMAEAA